MAGICGDEYAYRDPDYPSEDLVCSLDIGHRGAHVDESFAGAWWEDE